MAITNCLRSHCRDQLQKSESDINRRQILMFKVDTRARGVSRNEHANMVQVLCQI